MLGDLHGQRCRQTGVFFLVQADLGQPRRQRAVSSVLRNPDARRRESRLREPPIVSTQLGSERKGAIQGRRGAVDLADCALCLGRPQPQVHRLGRLPRPARHTQCVTSLGIDQRQLDLLGGRRDRARASFAAIARLFGARDSGMIPGYSLEQRSRRPSRRGINRPRLTQERQSALHVAPLDGEPRAIDEQQRAPLGIRSEARALGESRFARLGVAGAPGEHLECEPRACLFGHGGPVGTGRLPRRALGGREVAFDVRFVGSAHQQGANALVGRRGRSREGIDELA